MYSGDQRAMCPQTKAIFPTERKMMKNYTEYVLQNNFSPISDSKLGELPPSDVQQLSTFNSDSGEILPMLRGESTQLLKFF